jgi:hypothetical protein
VWFHCFRSALPGNSAVSVNIHHVVQLVPLVDTSQVNLLVNATVHTFNPYQVVLAHPVNTYQIILILLVKTVVLIFSANTYQVVLLFPGQNLQIVLMLPVIRYK